MPLRHRTKTRETQVRTLPWASSGHVTTRSMSSQQLRSPILTFVTKKLSTGANGQKGDAASFCPRNFDQAVIIRVNAFSVMRIKLNWKKTVFLCLSSCADETGEGSAEYCLCRVVLVDGSTTMTFKLPI